MTQHASMYNLYIQKLRFLEIEKKKNKRSPLSSTCCPTRSTIPMDRMSKRNTKRLESPLPTERIVSEKYLTMGQYLVGRKEKKKRPKNARKRSITLVIAANAVLILLTMQLASVFFKKIKIKNTGIAETVAASEIRKIRP